jgi:predicted metallo-beta-lactamase superfamily hydrolase
MITVEFEDERFLFAPDVQGPMSTRTLETILKEQPELVMIGGPPSYLASTKVSETQIQAGIGNLERIVDAVSYVILDHHILRDENWRKKTNIVFDHAYRSKHTLLTAAEFAGKENTLLEAARKTLFTEKPPSNEFQKWMRLGEEAKKHERPPI